LNLRESAENFVARAAQNRIQIPSMKYTFPRSAPVAAVLTLLSSIAASAHPGHSVLDPLAGPPHAGHADQWGSWLLAMTLTALLFAVSRAWSKRDLG
jgi:hypothetical protein